MFDLITGREKHLPSHPTAPILLSAKPKQTPPKAEAATANNQFGAPLEEPARIQALPDDEGIDFGVPGGVEGGIPGGVVGGVVWRFTRGSPTATTATAAGCAESASPRWWTNHTAQLLKRVEPEYPQLAVDAHIQGVVIVEATVGEDGDVMEVRLLRSANPLLDREAQKAVRQWRYSPAFSTEFAFHSSSPSPCRSSWKHGSKKERRGHGQGRYRYAEDRVGLQVEPPRIPAGGGR